jgi:multidrug efflux pump subunit AcrA (membrane-fusion protein)
MPAVSDPHPDPKPVPVAKPEPAPRPDRTRGLLVYGGLFLFGAAILLYYFVPWRTAQPPAQPPPAAAVQAEVVKVARGTLEGRVRITGSTRSTNFATLMAPRLRGPGMERAMSIVMLAPSGSMVKKGDIVAELDAQTLKDRIDDEVAELREDENSLKKRRFELELNMENLRQSLRVAKADLDKAQLDARAGEVRTPVDQELLNLAVEEAAAKFKQLQSSVPLTELSQKADYRNLEITCEIQKMRVERFTADLEKFVFRAPMDGMVVMLTQNRPGSREEVQIQAGDSIAPGQPFMRIVDPASMQVEATINQAESSHFRIGQEAAVGLDAYPGARYQAKVFSIGALASRTGFREQYYLRTVPIHVKIENPDRRVLPDLSASADVLLARADNVLLAPLAAVRKEKGETFVYVRGKQGFDRRPVSIGLSDGIRAAVVEGLREGEEIRVN